MFRALAVAAAVAVYGQIVLGAVVRITGSGLGCPDWPACGGRVIPNFTNSQVAIEYAHRLVGSAAGVLMVATALAAVAMYLRRRDRTSDAIPRGLAWAAVIGVLLIVFQGVLGGVTVLTGNTPFTVAIHLGNALLVLAAAVLVALWARRLAHPAPATARDSGSTAAFIVGAGAAFVIVLSGAYVVGTGAGAACPGWPLCGGAGSSSSTDIHMFHRVVVLAGSLAILWMAYRAHRRWRGAPMAVAAYVTIALLLAEVAVGAAQAVLGLPSPLRAAHVALASGVWTGAVLMAWAGWLETRAERSQAPVRRHALAGAES